MADSEHNAERQRLESQHAGMESWRLWGPYVAERAWGTVREDYSEHGTAWEHLDHDQARSRAYRWNEDGLGGVCDEGQHLCLALALWNGRDPILKERAFGLTGNQGNRGEDVKEYYFYRDATPSHSYLRYLYKYPQAAYPYAGLVEENGRRGRQDPPFQLLDTGVFDDSRYWDVEVFYAKASPAEIHCHIYVHNRGPEAAQIQVLPTLWCRNTWSWDDEQTGRPAIQAVAAPSGAAWAVCAQHQSLGSYHLYGAQPAELLFTENESNAERLWGLPNAQPYVKDAFHRRVIEGEEGAVNPAKTGTKFAAWDLAYHCPVLALVDVDFAKEQIELMLSERYLHPNGLIPAYEWAFGDVNPPVHAMGALKVYRAERVQRGAGDTNFLQRVFYKLLLNSTAFSGRNSPCPFPVSAGGNSISRRLQPCSASAW